MIHYKSDSYPFCIIYTTFIFFIQLTFSCYSADWPHFLGPYKNNTSSETELIKNWPESGLGRACTENSSFPYNSNEVLSGALPLVIGGS